MLETHYSLIDEIDCDYLHPDVFTLEINVPESENLCTYAYLTFEM